MKTKIKVGDKVKWKSFNQFDYGTVEAIKDGYKPIKVRPKPHYKGQKRTLVALKEHNAIVL